MNDVRMENKICYLLGDYNIDILNYASHVHTAQFVDMMSSSGFLPLITRPTGVTATSATLIDNIFTNYLEDIGHSIQGLFITDVSDHFPIFHVSRGMQMSDVDTHICRRLYSLRNKEEFCHAISTTNWDEINRATDTQQAFDLFHNRTSYWKWNQYVDKSIKWYSNWVSQHEFHVPEEIFWNSDQSTDPYLQSVFLAKEFSPVNWKLQMSSPCTKVMIQCCLIITDLFLYCVFSQRFLKKIMYNRVSAFLEMFKILHENQYGFRKKSSTHLALLSFIVKVIQAIEKGEYAIGIFLDFFQKPLIRLTMIFCWIN